MSVEIGIFIILFISLLGLGVPIAFVLGLVTALTAIALGYNDVALTVASDLSNGIDSFALLAIPFFILAGELMGSGGLARRLINLAFALLGKIPGGMTLVNTLTCMLFGAISGSAVAAISGIGGTLIPEMNRKGYGKDFNIAITASAATTGLLIPPSNIIIVYALVAGNVSVASLFLAGIIPGILTGLGIMLVGTWIALRRGYGKSTTEINLPHIPLLKSVFQAAPSLLLVIIVLGGILGGIFTATEASAIAVLWAFLLGVIFYREIKIRQLPDIFLKAARTTAVVLFLVACSSVMSQLLTLEQIPQLVSDAMLSLSENPIIILLLINIILLLVGIFMDMTPAVLIFTPIFLPIALKLGVDPVHFGIVMVANLSIGLLTPPVGTCLFVGAGVGKSDIISVSKEMIPFYLVMTLSLLAITYWPDLSLFLTQFSM